MRDIKYVTLNETCMETYQTPLKCNRRLNLNKNIKKKVVTVVTVVTLETVVTEVILVTAVTEVTVMKVVTVVAVVTLGTVVVEKI